MIDTSKYEGHTEGPWKLTHIKPNGVVDENFEISFIHTIRGEEIKIADVHWTPDQADGWEFENWKANAQLIADTPLLLAEVKRLREELDTIKSHRSFEYRFSPTAYGMAIEAWVSLTEGENSVNETFDDLRLLTEEEWWQWQGEDIDWPWDSEEITYRLDHAHYTYLCKCVETLEKEGGIMALKKRLQESGEE